MLSGIICMNLNLSLVLQRTGQIALLAAIWQFATWLVQQWHLPLPGNVLGCLLLLALLMTGKFQPRWCQSGARWLLSEMLLFFVPEVVAVINYQPLLLGQGWRIALVLIISTALVIGITALVVDRVYRLECRLAARKAQRV